MERARGSAMANSLSMYNITENIYYSQLSSVAILLQPEPNCFTSYNTRKGLCFLSLCAIALRSPPASHVSTSNSQWSSQLFCVYCRWCIYSPQITTWSPQGMRALRQCKAPRAQVMFATIQRENIRPSKNDIVTDSQVLFHDGTLLHSQFNTQLLITVHNSSRNLTHV
jgi:hypothetical protein